MCQNNSEGVSPERDVWSLCVFACWWLWGVVFVGSSSLPPPSPSPSASFCAGTNHLGEQVLKSLENDNIHKIHGPKFQGPAFSEVTEAPQAAATQPHRAWGP